MELRVLSRENCEQVRLWRNQDLSSLRTPFLLPREMQADFYRDRVSNRDSTDRFWGIWNMPDAGKRPVADFIGMGGITHIQWENSIGEISLLLSPECRGEGCGKEAVNLLLGQAFGYLNLKTVFGEVYECNLAWEFWEQIAYEGRTSDLIPGWVRLMNRKYWKGQYYDSAYFSFDRKDYVKPTNSTV